MGNSYDLYHEDNDREDVIFTGRIHLKVKNYFFIYDLKQQKLLYSDFRNLLNEIFYESYEIIDPKIFARSFSDKTKTIWLENFGTIKYIYPNKYVNRNLTKIFDRIFECKYNFSKIF